MPATDPAGERMRPGQGGAPGGRALDADRHDPYQSPGRYRDPTQCEDCGAVYAKCRWTWGGAPSRAAAALCPACRRLHDNVPAGRISLEGPFVAIHRTQLVRLVRDEADQDGREHPLRRLMRVEERPDRVDVTTTDIHLPRRIGDALRSAFDGELDIRYGENEYTVRVHWRR